MKVVQNNMVNMEWDANGYIESKKQGFICAIKLYNGKTPLVFKDGKVYTHILENRSAIDFDALVSTIKTAVKENDVDYPAYYDDYLEIYDGIEFSDSALELFGIEDSKEDILARLKDLGGYWGVTEVEQL